MEALENLSNDIDTYLPKLNKSQSILVLTQLGINTEGQSDVICNKRKLIRWIQNNYEDIMGDEERDLDAEVKHLQNLLNLFTDSIGEHHKNVVEQHDQGDTLQQQKNQHPMQNQQVQNNINLPWMVRRQQKKFMLVLQEVCTLCPT